jgi:hypothetical protein
MRATEVAPHHTHHGATMDTHDTTAGTPIEALEAHERQLVQAYEAQLAEQVRKTAIVESRAKMYEDQLRREREQRRDLIIRRLVSDGKGTDLPHGIDLDAMWERLLELVSDDDHECWTPNVEWAIEATYTVKVTCYVTATTEEEARDKFNEANVNFTANRDRNAEITLLDVEEHECEEFSATIN